MDETCTKWYDEELAADIAEHYRVPNPKSKKVQNEEE